jgi:hypothetical protein
MWLTFAVLGFGALALRADDLADRERLIGTWEGDDQSVWTLEQQKDQIRIQVRNGDRPIYEFACKPVGAECEGKDNGKALKAQMYFSGPALVQMETKGTDIIKRTFVLKSDATLDVETTPLVGTAKAEVVHLKRQSTAAAAPKPK